MKIPTLMTLALCVALTHVLAQEIPNPSFEQPEITPPIVIFTPGQPGYAESEAALRWGFGAGAGICPERTLYAEQVEAADGRQVAFIQGNIDDRNPEVDPPSCIMGIDVTGLETGQEYEISWQQAGRATDTGQTAVSVQIGAGAVPPLALLTKEPVGTRGEWERKSVWFLATAPTMRLNITHHILEAGSSTVGSESTLFDNFEIRAGRSAN
jgi:hypothetical protein